MNVLLCTLRHTNNFSLIKKKVYIVTLFQNFMYFCSQGHKCTFLLKTIYPNDDKTKNVFVKQEQRQNLFRLCRAEKTKAEGQLTNEARGGRPSLFGAMPCKEEEGEAKIRHIQYPKPNYKH